MWSAFADFENNALPAIDGGAFASVGLAPSSYAPSNVATMRYGPTFAGHNNPNARQPGMFQV